MTESSSKSSKNSTSGNYSISLMFLGLAIIIILLVLNYRKFDSFVANVPMTSIGSGPVLEVSRGVYPTGQPMFYEQQLYPAKLPWYPDVGRPCAEGCGATGICSGGVCQMRDNSKTVFNVKI